MKRYLLLLILPLVLLSFTGCKKKGFDPTTRDREDFVGTWKGTITAFKNNQLLKDSGYVVIYHKTDDLLGGIIFIDGVKSFYEFQFLSGTLYFKIPCMDPENPTCQMWNLGGYVSFKEEDQIDFRISGNECGSYGNEYVDWTGLLTKTDFNADTARYFHFAKTGNLYHYKVTLKSGDTCTLNKTVNNNPSRYLFYGVPSQGCGWNGMDSLFKWSVSPAEFSVINDSSISYQSFTFPIDAKPGVVYRNILHGDTTTLSLTGTGQVVTTPAGTFSCMVFKYTEPVVSGGVWFRKTAYLWLNTKYGIIRQEVDNPANSTDLKSQVLTSVNF